MRLIALISVLLFNFNAFTQDEGPDFLSQARRYAGYCENHAKEILELYPKEEYIVLFWGRTGNYMSEYMRQLSGQGDGYIIEAPLTSFKDANELQQMTALRNILPTEDQLNGRRLVIVRTIWEGHTFNEAFQIVFESLNNLLPRTDRVFHLIGANLPIESRIRANIQALQISHPDSPETYTRRVEDIFLRGIFSDYIHHDYQSSNDPYFEYSRLLPMTTEAVGNYNFDGFQVNPNYRHLQEFVRSELSDNTFKGCVVTLEEALI